MAIQITGTKVKVTPACDRVFVKKITIEQVRNRDNTATPVYKVGFDYQTYGLDELGQRHYDGEMHSISIDDYIVASQGNLTRLGAMAALEAALADVLADDPTVDSSTVV